MKSLLIAAQILRQNRWLWLLLTLWPLGMALMLSRGAGGMTPEDVQAWLQQECLYGWTVVAFAAGTMIGNEERSRRIALVMGRAVSRRGYLAAIWAAALVALLLYTSSVLASGGLLHAPGALLLRFAGVEFAVGVLLASVCLLSSLLLPGVMASGAGLGAVGALSYLAGSNGQGLALARVMRLLVGGAAHMVEDRTLFLGMAEGAALAAIVFAIAVVVFERQDLSLKTE